MLGGFSYVVSYFIGILVIEKAENLAMSFEASVQNTFDLAQ